MTSDNATPDLKPCRECGCPILKEDEYTTYSGFVCICGNRLTDEERQEALIWVNDIVRHVPAWGLSDDIDLSTIRRALSAPAPQPVDVEALKRRLISEISLEVGDFADVIGSAIDHIASEYDLTKKVKA